MSIWIIIAVIGQLLLNRPISAQLTSITLNTKNFVSLVAYGLAVDPDDDSLFIVYENPNPIDFLVGKYSSQGTLLWLNRYLSQSSPKVYHGDQQAHFHGGNIWLDSTGDDRKDLFVIAYKTTNGYDSSGYTVWRISGETGEINASTFISDSNSYPAGLVGDQNRNLYFGLTNAAGCALGRLPFDLNQTELSVVSTYNSSTCEMSAIATDGMNLYGAGSIKSVNAGSHLFLVRQPLATFSSVSRLLTVAQVNVPGAAYGMALDIGRGLIYLVGEDNILVSAGRVVCIFDLRSLSYRRKISDGSLNSRDAFYFAALHPSGELYVGGERWISADRQLVGLVKLASGSLSGRAIDTFSVNRAGFMAQFSPNKYDLYIVGKSADRPLLFKFTGARVAARTTPSSIITTTTTTITTPIPSSTNFYLTGISTKFTLLVSTTSTTLPFSLQTLQSTLSTSSFTTTISSTTDFINTTKSLISLPTKDVTGNNSVMDASDKSTAQAIVIGIGSGLAAFIIMALLMALISSKNPRKRRRIAAKPIGSLESRLQLKQSAVTLKSSIGNSASQSAISSSEMRLKQQSPQSGFPSNFLPV